MKLRVGFDCAALLRPYPPGLRRVVAGLVEALEARGRLQVVRLAPAPGSSETRWRQTELAGEPRRLELAGLHSCVSAFALGGRGRRVCTIHELPWEADEVENADFAHRLWVALAGLRADAVLTPGAHTLQALARQEWPRPQQLVLCHWGVGPPFALAQQAIDHQAERVLRGKLGLEGVPYVLAPGATRSKKRFELACAAVELLEHSGVRGWRLVRTGSSAPEHSSAHVLDLGWCSDEQLAALYRGASAVVVLARSEGFAFPALEAMACGAPLVTRPGGAAALLCGELSHACEPEDAQGLAQTLLLAREMRAELAPRRREFAAQYRWSSVAQRVEAVWERWA